MRQNNHKQDSMNELKILMCNRNYCKHSTKNRGVHLFSMGKSVQKIPVRLIIIKRL